MCIHKIALYKLVTLLLLLSLGHLLVSHELLGSCQYPTDCFLASALSRDLFVGNLKLHRLTTKNCKMHISYILKFMPQWAYLKSSSIACLLLKSISISPQQEFNELWCTSIKMFNMRSNSMKQVKSSYVMQKNLPWRTTPMAINKRPWVLDTQLVSPTHGLCAQIYLEQWFQFHTYKYTNSLYTWLSYMPLVQSWHSVTMLQKSPRP